MILRRPHASRFGYALLLSGLGGALLSVPTGHDSPAAAAAPKVPVALSVKFGGAGQIDASTVVVEVSPSVKTVRRVVKSGAKLPHWDLPKGAVKLKGRKLTVRIDPTKVPAKFVSDGGLVNFQVRAAAPKSDEVFYAFTSSMRARVGGKVAWVDPLISGKPNSAKTPVIAPGSLGSSKPLLAQGPSAAAAGTVESVKASPIKLSGAQAKATMSAMAKKETPGCNGGERAHPTKKTKKKYGVVGTSYPLKSSKSWLTYSESTKSSFGAGVSVGGKAFVKASGTVSVQDSWGNEFEKRNWKRSYEVLVEYRLYECRQYTVPVRVNRAVVWLPESAWGTREVKIKKKAPKWDSCGPLAAGKYSRGVVRGKDYSLSGGVKFKDVIGIDLDSRRAYTKEATVYYHNTKKRKLCAKSGNPTKAAKFRERK